MKKLSKELVKELHELISGAELQKLTVVLAALGGFEEEVSLLSKHQSVHNCHADNGLQYSKPVFQAQCERFDTAIENTLSKIQTRKEK